MAAISVSYPASSPDTLTTRHNIAFWTGQAGDTAQALRLCCKLLPDVERVLGPEHPDTLTTRHNIAHWTGQAGDTAEALRLFRKLVPTSRRCSAPNPLAR